MTKQISRREWEELSAYLDGQLIPREQARLEKKIQARPELRAALTELRRTRILLRNQPTIRSPRNFILSPAMAGAQRARQARSGVFQSLRLTSALASAFFVLVVLGDVFISNRMSRGALMIADSQVVQELSRSVAEAPVEEASVPATESLELSLEKQAQKDAGRVPGETGTPEAGMTMALPAIGVPATQPAYPLAGEPYALVTQSAYPAAEEPPPVAQLQELAPEAGLTAQAEETPVVVPTTTLEAETADVAESFPLAPGFWTIWRFFEAGLLLVGVITGTIAFHLWRTGRA